MVVGIFFFDDPLTVKDIHYWFMLGNRSICHIWKPSILFKKSYAVQHFIGLFADWLLEL